MLLSLMIAGAALASEPVRILPAADVQWEDLNPARGDQSPRAGTLWGDRHADVATGYLLRPVDGFESPPHLHNVSYRAVVIRGLLHNDDPGAARHWMPTGSFWTQPRGEVHITAAQGEDALAYVEIDAGPYLVRPVAQAFQTDERAVNVDVSNLVWLDAGGGARVSWLWGAAQDGAPGGAMLRLPAGTRVGVQAGGDVLRAVSVAGQPAHGPRAERRPLAPGSYLEAPGGTRQPLACEGSEDCLLYLRLEGPLEVEG